MTAILINDLGDGGAQKSLSRLLVGIQKDRIRLILIRDTVIQDLPDGIDPLILDVSGNKSILSLAFKLKRLIASEGVRLVQSHLYRSNFINVISRLLGSSHSIQLVNSGRAGRLLGEGFKGRLTLVLQKILYPHADLVICKSKGMAKDLERYVKGIRDIQVIPNSFDVHSLDSRPEDFWHQSTESETLEIVSLGRLITLKCHDLAIDSVYTLIDHKRSVRLTIYGDGRERRALESQVSARQLTDVISLAGYAEDPLKVLAKNQVLLSLSRTEGFPNVLVEAMIAGALVVSTDCVSGPREILAPDTNFDEIRIKGWEITSYGILVAVDDQEAIVEALEWVMDNPERVSIIKRNARERANEWDLSNIAPQYEALLFPKDAE